MSTRTNQLERVHRQQCIRQAEGYLDLAMALDDRWPLDLEHRCTLADRALDLLAEIHRPKGHLAHILFLKGQGYRVRQEWARAIEFFRDSWELDPENLHTLLAIAWCYKRVGQLERAIEAMETALRSDSTLAIAHYNLACYCALAGKKDRALDHLEIALDIHPDYLESIRSETDFDSLHGDDRFMSLADLIG